MHMTNPPYNHAAACPPYLLHHSVELGARRRPDHEAFRFEGTALSYAALDDRATRLARTLRDHGVVRGDRVGIFMNKCLEMPLAVYGILKAGAAYVPLDPAMPAERLRTIAIHCGIRHLVTQPGKMRILDDAVADTPLETLIGVESAPGDRKAVPWSEVDSAPALLEPFPLMEQDLAYIMYTSGSTGTPKGIMHTHASGLAYARMSAGTYDLRPDDRLGNHSPLHFDMSTLEYFSGPLAGACTVLIPEEYTRMPASLSQLIEKERLTIWYSVPFALIQMGLRGALDQRDLTSLRWVLFGGEPFPTRWLREWMERLPGARFSNVYGPAEVNQCTFWHVPEPPAPDADAVPLGHIWPNAEGRILDSDDRPVPSGEAGELVVRTPTMMQGYWARPDLNERTFYRERDESGFERIFYRTGDLVREDNEGILHFLGRIDRQVKVRGHRVELDEIEAALSECPPVAEGAVFTVPGEDGDTRIEAAVTLREDAGEDATAVLAFLRTRLPAYALPRHIAVMDGFPRTGTGKIDRRALREGAMAPETGH